MASLRSLLGAALITGACSTPSAAPTEPLILDFGKGEATGWRALNDGVMGGRSIGVVDYGRNTMTWEGTDLSGFGSMTFRCRTTTGATDTFTLTMETHEQWWMPYWKANFSVEPEWSKVTLNFADLKKSSAMTGDLPKLWSWGALDDILRIGMMKYDGTAGDFGLEVDWIRFNPIR